MKNSRGRHRHGLEPLEPRRFLSADVAITGCAKPHFHADPDVHGGITGYSPAQVRKAYGFDQISFGGASGSGAGQTIAIVDAFHDPNILADLKVFDAQFGLADPPSFKQVSQTGGSPNSLLQDSGWASEAALDVEWAHAIAPAANILLVEANSDSYRDLMRGVDLARHMAGVSVVSTSWGGSEWSGQTAYDTAFTTPTGHAPVTFVASSGDDGTLDGAEWPATSPNVVAVGGTVLKMTNSAGTYGSEIAWNYSTGGSSTIERAPGCQRSAIGGRMRNSPDVAYNSSVIHGFAVYSSVPDGGTVGWSNVGGTSAGAPQWAALVAIANQGRALQGKAALDGPTGVLPTLYSMYSAPGTANYSAYTADFHDITTGTVVDNGTARVGWDNATGLGTPKAAAVVSALVNKTPATTLKAATTTTSSRKSGSAKPHAAHGTGSLSEGDGTTTDAGQGTSGSSSSAVSLTPVMYPSVIAVSNGSSRNVTLTADSSVLGAAASSASPARGGASAVSYSAAPDHSGYTFADAPAVSADAALQWDGSSRASAGAVASANPTAALEIIATPVVPTALPAVPSLFVIRPTREFNFAHPEAATAFADSLSAFVHDSTALATAVLPAGGNLRAWSITAAVLTVDAILVGSWYASYRRAKQKSRVVVAARVWPFATERSEW